MISLIIPVTTSNSEYTEYIQKNIKELYSHLEDNLEIIVNVSDTMTLGHNYNDAVSKATGNLIILLHNDMVLHPDFLDIILKHSRKGRILTYTRIEPPVYTDTYPGKIIYPLGYSLSDFNKERFNNWICNPNTLTPGGSQLFFSCFKEDYIGIDGSTFKMFCEDDDIHLRYKLLGYEHMVCDATVYHFVSKTSRQKDNSLIELNSNRNFIRKWGFRHSIYNTRYNISYKINNCTDELLYHVEPYAKFVFVDNSNGIIERYIDREQINTSTNLSRKLQETDALPITHVDILVEFDANDFKNSNYIQLGNLSDIIYQTHEKGKFTLDNLNITIFNKDDYSRSLIQL